MPTVQHRRSDHRHLTRAWLSAALSALLMFSAGCGPGEPEAVSIWGKVTLDGKQVPYGTVSFMGDGAGRAVTSSIASDGAYKLAVVPGEYRVAVNAQPPFAPYEPDWSYEGGVPPTAKRVKGPTVPDVYGSHLTSGLTCEVPAVGEKEVNIPLKRLNNAGRR